MTGPLKALKPFLPSMHSLGATGAFHARTTPPGIDPVGSRVLADDGRCQAVCPGSVLVLYLKRINCLFPREMKKGSEECQGLTPLMFPP